MTPTPLNTDGKTQYKSCSTYEENVKGLKLVAKWKNIIVSVPEASATPASIIYALPQSFCSYVNSKLHERWPKKKIKMRYKN